MSSIIVAKKMITPQERMQRAAAPTRPAKRAAGGWISDLTAIKQCVLLCEFCQRKFNPRAHHYRRLPHDAVTARCDGCKAVSIRSAAYVAEETYSQVVDERPRHRGRWA